MKKEGGQVSKMAVVSIEYGTLAIEVGSVLNFAVVFSSTYFLFLFGGRWREGETEIAEGVEIER